MQHRVSTRIRRFSCQIANLWLTPMHRRHAPQPLPITAGQIDQPLVGHLGFPLGAFGYLPEAEFSFSTINCFFAPASMHRTACGRQYGNGQNDYVIDAFNRQENRTLSASISGSHRKLPRPLSTHSGVMAAPVEMVERVDPSASAISSWTVWSSPRRPLPASGLRQATTRGDAQSRPGSFFPADAQRVARAEYRRPAPRCASAGLAPPADGCGRVPSPRAGTLVLTSLITRPGRVAGGRGTFLREPSAHVVARTQPAAWADGLRAG